MMGNNAKQVGPQQNDEDNDDNDTVQKTSITDKCYKNRALVLLDGDNVLHLSPECEHIHLTYSGCELLLHGFIRDIDNESCWVISIDIYNECWKYFKLLTQMKTQTFDTGIFYSGCQCQINTLNLKSINSKNSIQMRFIYKDENANADSVLKMRWVWLSYKGLDTDYTYQEMGNLKSEQSFEQQTFVTHPWKLFNTSHFIGLYLPVSDHPLHCIHVSNFTGNIDRMTVVCKKG